MNIGAMQEVSLQDYPGKVSCIVFCQGCNFRCGYCHNPELISCNEGKINEEEFFSFLDKRKEMLDGVVITGGEPTVQKDLVEFLRKIKKRDFSIKLDTNGSHYDVIKRILEEKLVDYVAMDYKYSEKRYDQITRVKSNDVKKSKNLIINGKTSYEFRITFVDELFDDEVMDDICGELKDAKKVVLQKFDNKKIYDEKFREFNSHNIIKMQRKLEFHKIQVKIR